MKKVCRESAVKASPITFFNFGKYLRQLMHAKDIKISYFKRHPEKGNLVFSFARSPILWTSL